MIPRLSASLAIAVALLTAQVPKDGESLQFTINWPSGLSLGEATLNASSKGEGKWGFELVLEAAVPGFAVSDTFRSLTSGEQCSLLFEKDLQHGSRKTKEKITFQADTATATRETVGGGKSAMPIPACAHDALAFVYHLRKELGQGRIPPEQDVYYGAPYRVKISYGGTRRIRVGNAYEETDRILTTVKGPKTTVEFELFVAKDDARTPVALKLPLELGNFAVEIVR